MMLTGNADQQTAIDAVNEGNIFRFLTKPCPPDIVVKALNAGMEQYRLETVAKIVAYQEKHFDGSGVPCDGKRGEEIPLGARILKLALDFDSLVTSGNTDAEALGVICKKNAWYDPAIIESLARVLATEIRTDIKSVQVDELALTMILAEDVKTFSGTLIVAKGHEVTPLLRIRLKNWLKMGKNA